MGRTRGQRAAFSALLLTVSLAIADESATDPVRAAEPARLAARGLLIAIATAGERLVAVGDRGIIVLSDDRGASWRQAEYVPTQALLTGVCFLDAQHGVAVGHDEVILTTADAGAHWQRTHYAPEAQRPLLDVWCGTGGQAIAVGAYSAYLTSADGGASWHAVKFNPASPAARSGSRAPAAPPPTAADAADEQGAGGGYHLNRIVGGGRGRLYLAAEAGHLYASDDQGASWRALASPYEGSFFGVLPLADGTLLAFGLRGHLYRSADAGASWQAIETSTVAMLTGAAPFGPDAIAVVGLAGVVLVSRDGGRSFTLQQQADRSGLSGVSAAGEARLAVVGEDGARLIVLAGAGGVAGGAAP
ncbi:MAG: WD40/YVTN/BNR-like repeat-containing protein [Steroidobacteraceae bacterium]